MSTHGLARLLSRSAVAQALSSLVSFGLSLFVILKAPKEDFGLFSLVLAALWLGVAAANALVGLQMPVLYDHGKQEAGYFATLYQVLLRGALLVSVGVALLAALACWGGWLPKRGLWLVLATLCLLVVQVTVEFVRQMHFMLEAIAAVVRMRLASMAVIASGCAGLWRLDGVDFLLACLALYALGQLVGLVFADWSRLMPEQASGLTAMARRAWRQGRWALLNSLFLWLASQGFLYLLSLYAGLGAVAEVNAAYNFVAPLILLSTSFMQVMLPRMSAIVDQDAAGVTALRHTVLRVLAGIVVGYALLLWLLFPWVESRFLAVRGYRDVGLYVGLWLVAMAVTFYRGNLAVVLQAMNRYHRIARLSSLYALLGLGLALALIPPWAGLGALLARALNEGIFVVLLRRALIGERRLKAWQW